MAELDQFTGHRMEDRRARFGSVPNGTLNPRCLPRSLHFHDVMPLWLSGRSLQRSSPHCRLGRSAGRGCITAAKGALASTLLKAKMRKGTTYSLVDLTDTRGGHCKTASAHEVFHLGQGRSQEGYWKAPPVVIEIVSVLRRALRTAHAHWLV